eukprot:sb/3479174/
MGPTRRSNTIYSRTPIYRAPIYRNPDLPEPRFTGRVNFPQNRKLSVFDPNIPGTPIYRAKPFPPSIPVNRGPTVWAYHVTHHIWACHNTIYGHVT